MGVGEDLARSEATGRREIVSRDEELEAERLREGTQQRDREELGRRLEEFNRQLEALQLSLDRQHIGKEGLGRRLTGIRLPEVGVGSIESLQEVTVAAEAENLIQRPPSCMVPGGKSPIGNEGLSLKSRVAPGLGTTRDNRDIRARPIIGGRRRGAAAAFVSGEYLTPREVREGEMSAPGGERGAPVASVHTPGHASMVGTAAPATNLLGQQAGTPVSVAAASAYRPGLSRNEPLGSSRPGLGTRDLGASMETRTYHLDEEPYEETYMEVPPHVVRPSKLVGLRQTPTFDGSNPRLWLIQVEKFFRAIGATEAERMTAVSICLEGEALTHWGTLCNEGEEPATWAEFKQMCLERFGCNPSSTTVDKLRALKYKGDLRALSNKFAAILEEGEPLNPWLTFHIYMGRIPPLMAADAMRHKFSRWTQVRDYLLDVNKAVQEQAYMYMQEADTEYKQEVVKAGMLYSYGWTTKSQVDQIRRGQEERPSEDHHKGQRQETRPGKQGGVKDERQNGAPTCHLTWLADR
ncbi:hypothetical protein Emed_007560 [Eimeria media]